MPTSKIFLAPVALVLACQISTTPVPNDGIVGVPREHYPATLTVTWPDATTSVRQLGARAQIILEASPAPETCHPMGWVRLFESEQWASTPVGALPVTIGADHAAPATLQLGPDTLSTEPDNTGSGFSLTTERGTLTSLGDVVVTVQPHRLELVTSTATLCVDGTCTDDMALTIVLETEIDLYGKILDEGDPDNRVIYSDCFAWETVNGTSSMNGEPLCWDASLVDCNPDSASP